MTYDFVCKCGLEFSQEFEAFSCPDTVPCKCGKVAKAKTVDIPMMKRVLTEID